MTPEGEEENVLLRLYREKETLLWSFFAGRRLESRYCGVRIVIENNVAILRGPTSTIATFDGRVLKIPGHLSGEYQSSVYDAIVKDGCEAFSGGAGIQVAERLNARWTPDWWTLCYDRSMTIGMIPYPFMINVVGLMLHLPCGFFVDFLRFGQESTYRILSQLSDIIEIPEDIKTRVITEMFEMKMDRATST